MTKLQYWTVIGNRVAQWCPTCPSFSDSIQGLHDCLIHIVDAPLIMERNALDRRTLYFLAEPGNLPVDVRCVFHS